MLNELRSRRYFGIFRTPAPAARARNSGYHTGRVALSPEYFVYFLDHFLMLVTVRAGARRTGRRIVSPLRGFEESWDAFPWAGAHC